jgi:hypothetical protein
LVLGHPWWGVVLSSILMMLVSAWAFLVWLPERWAFGATLLALIVVLGTYWSDSYWGGSVAATGGALVLGAIGRIRARQQLSDWIAWAAGCVVLVCSRPYEGGVLVLLSTAELARIFFSRMRAGEETSRQMARGFLTGALPIGVAGMALLATYCQATTGRPWRLPYLENTAQYQIRRTFWWQNNRTPPTYRHESMRRVYVGLLRADRSSGELYSGILKNFAGLYGGRAIFWLGIVLLLLAYRPGFRFIVLSAITGLAAVFSIVFVHQHYYAPFTAFLLVAFAEGARRLTEFKGLSPPMRTAAIGVMCALVVTQMYRRVTREYGATTPWVTERESITHRLSNTPGKHLVLVRYSDDHDIHKEWVYNEADMEDSRILWARWWTPSKNSQIAEYFRDRRVWIVNADEVPARVEPYEPNPGYLASEPR